MINYFRFAMIKSEETWQRNLKQLNKLTKKSLPRMRVSKFTSQSNRWARKQSKMFLFMKLPSIVQIQSLIKEREWECHRLTKTKKIGQVLCFSVLEEFHCHPQRNSVKCLIDLLTDINISSRQKQMAVEFSKNFDRNSDRKNTSYEGI